MKIGVLALQGDFAEHLQAIEQCGAQALPVRRSFQLEEVDGLIIPGGESTTIAKLTNSDNTIFDTITNKIKSGMPVYGHLHGCHISC